jgi:5-methyltetrahydrofolate--homocysteine methyltransferase
VIFDILDAERRMGVKLTESSAMEPPASVAGFIFAHPKSDYFSIASIGMDQLEDLANRRGVSKEEARRLLGAVSVID